MSFYFFCFNFNTLLTHKSNHFKNYHVSIIQNEKTLRKRCSTSIIFRKNKITKSISKKIWYYFLNELFIVILESLIEPVTEIHLADFVLMIAEARNSNQRGWLLNACFLLARCHLLQNNRPEARVVLLEGLSLARSYALYDVAAFFDTVSNSAFT